MKSISLTGLFVSTLVVSASAIPHFNSIFGRGAQDSCYTQYGEGRCQIPKLCKGISVGGRYCGGGYGGGYENQCCVELVCKVSAGTGYCRSVKNGGCPGGSFQYSDYGSSEWPCTGGDTQCCVQSQTPYPPSPDSDDTSSNSSSEYPGGDARIHGKAIKMIKELEGFRGDIYKDQVGVDTIGYGHNCATAPGTCEALKTPITEKEGEDLMMKDMKQFEKCICDLPNSEELSSNQFCAMVSYAFNTGCYGTRDHFTEMMSKKDYHGICTSLPTTNTLGEVLKSRREEEAKLCNTPTKQFSGYLGSRQTPRGLGNLMRYFDAPDVLHPYAHLNSCIQAENKNRRKEKEFTVQSHERRSGHRAAEERRGHLVNC
ncbi:unnamed protein product [Tuber aestivum]|uniref:Lysozyme n=1 Tax=Tuber aestivum TaxID=59557 RepID=A0A292PMS6_9PEZI|nr:unnamed protein product [Tuber aestivum]